MFYLSRGLDGLDLSAISNFAHVSCLHEAMDEAQGTRHYPISCFSSDTFLIRTSCSVMRLGQALKR